MAESTSPVAAAGAAPPSSKKKDALHAIERDVQALWEAEHTFEADPPRATDAEQPDGKYMATFPYPYTNGKLHLGHVFTVTKAEFAVNFQRLNGKRALFPFGFHCTGMPIKAAADRLRKELESGRTSTAELKAEARRVRDEKLAAQRAAGVDVEAEARRVAEEAARAKAEADAAPKEGKAFHSKKSKVANKAVASAGDDDVDVPMTQYDIMLANGIAADEIPAFADARHWLDYFPPRAMADLKAMGACIDWRRSFITTDVNPYYDAFVRWQFETLRELDKLQFGKRLAVYSPVDGQVCLDHERSSGEGVMPLDYTLIKMRVEAVPESAPAALRALVADDKRRVFMMCATMRPETMYGQTNCWVAPEGEYGAFEFANDEVYIMSRRAARNLAHQGFLDRKDEFFAKQFGVVVDALDAPLRGTDIIGCRVHAPLSHYASVYVLPMFNVSAAKGTGVVTSVPSDSPDDYATLRDLKQKEPLRAKYAIKDEWVLPFEAQPIIDIRVDGLGTLSAVKACDQFKVASQNDRDPLKKAKDLCYKAGFYDGFMAVGEHAGRQVQEVKPLLRKALIDAGDALPYSEPEGEVVSRSQDVCVVAAVDQWSLKYGDDEAWKAQCRDALEQLECYCTETRNLYNYNVERINAWACSRAFGLGSRLPWDKDFLIESLSDSTIYMAYYTVCHYFHSSLDGSRPGIAATPIKPEQLTNAVFNYLFRGAELPADSTIERSTLEAMRAEFEYWYPMDMRVSGKDLVNNHLTFMLYNHTAMFERHHWPRSVRSNGHIMVKTPEGKLEKMSKSKGTFLVLSNAGMSKTPGEAAPIRGAVQDYSVDALRMALADGGDSTDDATFDPDMANSSTLRLHTQLESFKTWTAAFDSMRSDALGFFDRAFDSEMTKCVHAAHAAYTATSFREAQRMAFHELQAARDRWVDRYQAAYEPARLHVALARKFITVQAIVMAPIAPHFAEHVWRNVLKRPGSAMHARWPRDGDGADELSPVDAPLLERIAYLDDTAHAFNTKWVVQEKEATKKKAPTKRAAYAAHVYVAREYPAWQATVITRVVELMADKRTEFPEPKAVATALKDAKFDKPTQKKLMPFVMQLAQAFKTHGDKALQLATTFDEAQFLREHAAVAVKGFATCTVHASSDDASSLPACLTEQRRATATPGSPAIAFELEGDEKK